MHYNSIRRLSHANNLTVRNATHVGQKTEYVESVMADWREVVKEKISEVASMHCIQGNTKRTSS